MPIFRRYLSTTLVIALGLGGSGYAAAQEARQAQEVLSAEAQELQSALENLDQSYEYQGLRSGHGSARVGGGRYNDPTASQRVRQRRSAAPEAMPPLQVPPKP